MRAHVLLSEMVPSRSGLPLNWAGISFYKLGIVLFNLVPLIAIACVVH